jgi:BirA family biotin operon repressor/biotin-[acetyl-CoA-carboxylase] ligase
LADWPADIANLVVLSEVDSTNALARRTLARAPARVPVAQEAPVFPVAPTAIAAWSQSGGRGRLGRIWESPAGRGAWVSLVQPSVGARELARLPVLLPVTLCLALRSLGVRQCGLRWPNDLVAGGRKLGGVLIEAVSAGDRPAAAILGFGVNLMAPDPGRVSRPAVGVAELVEPAPSVGRLTRSLMDAVVAALAEASEDLVGAYDRLSVLERGEQLVCRLGAETIEGRFAGFDEHGFLRLSAPEGERIIFAGELIER